MRTSKFTVEQIAHALKRVEGGVVVGEMCRELGITEATYYRWKKKFGGISTPELRLVTRWMQERMSWRWMRRHCPQGCASCVWRHPHEAHTAVRDAAVTPASWHREAARAPAARAASSWFGVGGWRGPTLPCARISPAGCGGAVSARS